MSAELLVLVVVISLAVVAALLVAYLTAHRLDRLHIRTDQARTALAGALERRHTAATAIARDVATRDPYAAERITTTVAAARTHRPGAIAGTDPAPDPDRRLARSTPRPRGRTRRERSRDGAVHGRCSCAPAGPRS